MKRWQASPHRPEELSEEERGRGASTTGQTDSGGENKRGGGEGERITELTKRAQQARRRAGTDIHTAAWRGDLALVKVGVVLSLEVYWKFCVPCRMGRLADVSMAGPRGDTTRLTCPPLFSSSRSTP